MAQQDKLIRQQLRATDAEIKLFINKMEGILNSSVKEISGQINSTSSPIDALVRINDFENVLIEAGLNKELRRLRSIYADELKHIRDLIQLSGVSDFAFSGVDRVLVEQLITADLNRIGNTLAKHNIEIKSVIARQVITGTPIDLSNINTTAKTLGQMQTEVNTGLQSFNRTVTIKKGQDLYGDNPKYEYKGQLDNITRPFCRKILTDRSPAIYSLEEIKALDNDPLITLPPVFANGGGWNCRHRWRLARSKFQDGD